MIYDCFGFLGNINMKNIRFKRPSSAAATALRGLANVQPSPTGTPIQRLKYQISEFTNKTDGEYTVIFWRPSWRPSPL